MIGQTIGRRRPSFPSSATDRKSLNSLRSLPHIPYENLQGIWAVNAKTYDRPPVLILRVSQRSALHIHRAARIDRPPYTPPIDLSTTTINPLPTPHAPACDPWRETGLGAIDQAGPVGDILLAMGTIGNHSVTWLPIVSHRINFDFQEKGTTGNHFPVSGLTCARMRDIHISTYL